MERGSVGNSLDGAFRSVLKALTWTRMVCETEDAAKVNAVEAVFIVQNRNSNLYAIRTGLDA